MRLWALLFCLLLASAGCGGGDSDGPSGAGGEGGGGSGGGGGEEPNAPWSAGCLQELCEEDILDGIDRICVEDECLAAGLQTDGDGKLIRANLQFHGQIPHNFPFDRIRGVAATLFHPMRPDGGTLDCAGLLSLPPSLRREEGYTNVVGFASMRAAAEPGDSYMPIPVYRVPVGEAFIALVEFFNESPETDTRPRGQAIVQGCIVVDVVEGHWADDQSDPRFNFVVKTTEVKASGA